MVATNTVDQHLIIQFSDQMHVRAQQIQSRFRPYVVLRRMTGDRFAYDGLGTVEARELTSRYNPTVFDQMEHFRRLITKRRFSVTIPVDKNDLEGFLTDPQGQYAQAIMFAMERQYDLVCMDSLFADVKAGRDFENTITFTADGGLTVDATGGLTYPKVLDIDRNFIDNEVGLESSNVQDAGTCFGITGEEHETLMQIDQFINSRYTMQFAVEKGRLVRVLNMEVIKFGGSVKRPVLPVGKDGVGVRTCFALAREGLCVGMAREWEITVKDRPDLVDTRQIQITGVMGAVRTEGIRVQKVKTTV